MCIEGIMTETIHCCIYVHRRSLKNQVYLTENVIHAHVVKIQFQRTVIRF